MPFGASGTPGQITTVKRFEIPGFAGSDIMQNAPVRLASGGDWTFVMCQSSAEKPVGVARDYAAAGEAVSVYDDGNILRTLPGAGGSFAGDSYLGVIGTSTGVHPHSGVTVTYPVLGKVSAAVNNIVGGSGTSIWTIGPAYESAAPGDQAAFRIEPRLLSGLVSN